MPAFQRECSIVSFRARNDISGILKIVFFEVALIEESGVFATAKTPLVF